MVTILCPTDFTKGSKNAIKYADEIAQRMTSHVLLCHTISEPVSSAFSTTGEESGYPTKDEIKRRMKKLSKLKEMKESLEDNGWGISVSYETKIRYGEAQQKITHLAQEEKADLVVLGTEEPQGLDNLSAHSLADQVAQQVSCPVLLIPNKVSFKPLRRIVVATDLRGFCPADMSVVLKLASYFGAQIQLLHVLPKENSMARKFSMEELERLSKRISYQRVSHHVEVNASIPEGISQFCRKNRADMLVMGAHTTDSWAHLFRSGSEENHPLPLPLLLVHAKRIRV
ncbi:universal stress protein [Rufibacter latericius]|uniref:Universal stress protein n=1 Tax=Rufibacter latericius TaxID=2487040 RepID=A0A3M9M8W1_9BACT|nr:universal stress protein [Rufibacter latericius]RNI21999.1 universal stress protein [Rufibacter latericius]